MINFFSVVRLTGDPHLSTLQGGAEMVKFSIAESSGKGKYARELFLDCVMFGNRCGVFMEWVHKGDQISLAGELSTQNWIDSETGKKRYKNELKVMDFSFVGKHSDKTILPQTQQSLPIKDGEAPF